MENNTETDMCEIAYRAALDTLKEHCGGRVQGETEVDIGGVIVKVTPDETVMRVREEPGLTDEQKVKAIKESALAQDQAKRLCTRLFGTVTGTDEYEKCVERVSSNLARSLMAIELDVRRIRKEKQQKIDKEKQQEIDKEKREERLSSEKTWG